MTSPARSTNQHPRRCAMSCSPWRNGRDFPCAEPRTSASRAGKPIRRENGPPVNDLTDIPPAEIPTLPSTPSPKPMPNFPITDIAGANSGGPNNGA